MESFAEFSARKTAEAAAAALPPYSTELEQPSESMRRVGNTWSRRIFDGDFFLSPSAPAGRPSCSLVFVQSHDGNTGAPDPGDLGGGETDKHVVYEGLSRVAADAVMAGAETARGGAVVFSVWHPELVALRAACGLPRHPVQIVATLRGLDLERGMLFNTPDIRVVLVTVASCAEAMAPSLAGRPWIATVAMPHAVDLAAAFARLRGMGIARLSCVGGRQLAGSLIDAGLVDDLHLTTAARAGGVPGTPLYARPLPPHRTVVRKHGTGPEQGVVFSHLAFPRT